MDQLIRTLLAWTVVACSTALAAEHRTIGRIEGTINGQAKIWHLIYSEEDASHSALRVQLEGQESMAILGGYESLDVEFSRDANGSPSVSGPGSMLVINFRIPAGADNAIYQLPHQGAEVAGVIYLPKVGDYAGMYAMHDGVVEVTRVDIAAAANGEFAGTFSGSFLAMDAAGQPIEITAGRFEAEGMRRMKSP